MSHAKTSKRCSSSKNELVSPKYHLNDIQSVLNTLLSPITEEISLLTKMITSLLNIIKKKDGNESEKVIKNCEFASTSIATDVTMMASSLHRLTKSYESIKEQVFENQKSIEKFYAKLNNVEKLVTTFLKIENNRAMKQMDDQILEKVSNLEQMLVGELDVKQDNDSFQSGENSKRKKSSSSVALDPSLQLITLNCKDDFPNGTWLGDNSAAKLRVRCPIPEEDLIYINTTCATPEKMALTLLDYLFTRDVLAVSNLSGKSKLGKKKLDPLMIYGIKCHLMYHFNISEKHWERIKLKMDSKCRSAWKKRKLSEPNQGFLGKSLNEIIDRSSAKEDSDSTEAIEEVMVDGLKAQVIHMTQGNIEVLQTTQDQILIHSIPNGDYILPVMDIEPDESNVAIPISASDSDVKKECEDNLTIITTNDSDLHAGSAVSFVTEPMLEVFTERDSLKIEPSVLIEEG